MCTCVLKNLQPKVNKEEIEDAKSLKWFGGHLPTSTLQEIPYWVPV